MFRLTLAVVMVVALVLPAGTAAAEESATLWGVVFDAAGNPSPGYGVVVQDAASGAMWTSAPSSTAGQYQVTVPVGASYRTIGLVSPSGARLTIDPGVPLSARRPVRYRLDVQIPAVQPAPGSAATGAAPASAPGSGADERSPWWKSPGGIIGLVAVQGAVLAVILSNNNDEPAASPSAP